MKSSTTAARQNPKGVKAKEAASSNDRIVYESAETQFETLLETEALDLNLTSLHPIIRDFERTLEHALSAAYQDFPASETAHLFLQRVLYRINRLKLFWFDDLRRYENERSVYIRTIRAQIEEAWQLWERQWIDVPALKEIEVEESLREAARCDLESKPSEAGVFFRDHVREAGYRRLLEIASLDGLVEASQLSRMLGGVGNEIHSTLTKLFLEEYGGGRLSRKHSTFFEAMLSAFDMQTKPEAYFDVVPWEVLAGINHSFLLTECKRYFLRYMGGLLYTEVSVPSAFRNYSAAAKRLDLPQTAMGYWDLHIKEDARHGRWMLYDIALPLAKRYPADAWELVFGYKQQRLISRRAGDAIARLARIADLENRKYR
ncbi:iron-containing redox enzyme family protein [Nitrospira defluvii]|nr:iron-containing redox enzyme family protein [Nitrospira defluvii]